MKKAIFISFILGFVFVLTHDSLHAQDRINYLELKEFIRQYEAATMDLAVDPDVDDTPITQRESRYRALFYHDGVPVYNFIEGTGSRQSTVDDFLYATRTYREENFIPDGRDFVTREPFFYLDDFELMREKRNGIVTIRMKQVVSFENYNSGEIEKFSDDLYLTLLYARDSDFQILRIDRADYAFADGLGSGMLLPTSIDASGAINHSRLSHDVFSDHAFLDNPGADFSLRFNYDLSGSRNYNLQLSTGLSYSGFHNSISAKGIDNVVLPGMVDIDGDEYALSVHGDFGHTVSQHFLGLPLEFNNIWHLGSNRLSFGVGMQYMFALGNPSFDPQQGLLQYDGIYDFQVGEDSYEVTLTNLPRYGFASYDYQDFDQIYEPALNNPIIGSVNLKYTRQLTNELSIQMGPSYHHAFNDFVSEGNPGDLLSVNEQGGVEAKALNLLSLGTSPTMSGIGFSIGVSYQLQRPNVPYRPHVRYTHIYQDLSRLRRRDLDEQHDPLNIYLINPYPDVTISDKNFNRNRFGNEVKGIISREFYDDDREALIYIAFDDSLFVRDADFDMGDVLTVLYRADVTDEGRYVTTGELDNFSNALIDSNVPWQNRRINFHFIMASPFAYYDDDAYLFIEEFANRFIGENYRFASFHLYTPILRYHRDRAGALTQRDAMLNDLIETINLGPTGPYNFDYHYELIDIQ